MKRFLDIILSFCAIIILLPFFLIISLLVAIESRGGALYKQSRVGRYNRDFTIYKFRTMKNGSDRKGLLTVGENDHRITKIGYFLRKYKLDELPQLMNIIKGDMSIVGPRPEVRRYVALYDEEQLKVLSVRPGLTDYASLKYINESKLLSEVENPEDYYIYHIMPKKIELNLQYIKKQSLKVDMKIMIATMRRLF